MLYNWSNLNSMVYIYTYHKDQNTGTSLGLSEDRIYTTLNSHNNLNNHAYDSKTCFVITT